MTAPCRTVTGEVSFVGSGRGAKHFAQSGAKAPVGRELTRFTPTGYLGGSGRGLLGPYSPYAVSIETRKRMRLDPQVRLALAAIKAPILGLPWRAESAEPGLARFVEAALRPLWRSLLRSALNAVDFGFQVHEKVWEVADLVVEERGAASGLRTYRDIVTYRKLKDLDPASVVILTDEGGDFAGFRQLATDVVVPAEKAFVVTCEREWGNLHGTSRLDAAYEPWYWCRVMYASCNRYFERKGDPPIKGHAPAEVRLDADGKEVNSLDEANAVIQSLRAGGTAVFPDERDEHGNPRWDFNFLLDDKRADMFLAYIQHLEVLKLRALLVPERVLTHEGAAGSYALAAEHTDTFLRSEELLIQELLDHVNRYLIPQLLFYNFGPDVPPVRITTPGLSRANQELMKELVLRLLGAEASERDARRPALAGLLDAVKLLEELNLPVRGEGEAGGRPTSADVTPGATEAPRTDLAAGSADGASASVQPAASAAGAGQADGRSEEAAAGGGRGASS